MREAFVQKALTQGLGAPRRDSVPSCTGLRSAEDRHSLRSLSTGSANGPCKQSPKNRVTSIKLYKWPLGASVFPEEFPSFSPQEHRLRRKIKGEVCLTLPFLYGL
jgi:hypothetical protein